jgi:pimeloyl-ACP methyl ester carboxylesterase
MWVKLAGLLAMPVVLYAAVLGYLFLAQTSMIFPAGNVPPGPAMPPSAERMEIPREAGVTLVGAHLPPRDADPAARLTVLGFGGNGWNADAMALTLRDLYPTADIVVFFYRGYQPSGGKPSADALKADARIVYDHVRARFPDAPIVAVGFSVGTGVAVSLAAARPLDGVILVTPFDSLAEVVSRHFPWLPVRWLLRQRMDSVADIRSAHMPVAAVVAGNDTLIPPAHARALERAVPDLILSETLPGAGHDSIYNHLRFRPVMREAMARILAR